MSKIGGQAVLEGVMMRGQKSVATAVRTQDGRIEVETSRTSQKKKWWMKVPVLRGFINFFYMMIVGSKVLTRSAELYGEEEGEPTKLELYLAEKSKYSLMDIAIFIGVLLGVVMAVGLFIALPVGVTKLFDLIPGFSDIFYVWKNLIASAVKLVVLFGYLILVGLIGDIKRVYMYHGAEHKVISCYEHGLDLTVENARKMSRLHDRCGTSFLVITVLVSVICTAFLPTFDEYNGIASFLLRFVTRLALLPIVAGIAYEVLKGLAKFDNRFVRAIKMPGLLFQKFTTREPDDSMLEVSLTAFKTVLAMDADESIPTTKFNVKKDYKLVRREAEAKLKNVEESDAIIDWVFVHYLNVSRSELSLQTKIGEDIAENVLAVCEKIREGEPMQYALGETEFYGYKLKVDSRVLIPRDDTETLVEEALKSGINETSKVIDLCTGSGAVAIAIKLQTNASVTAIDISEDALCVAQENAQTLGAEITLAKSDMFANIEGEFDFITANPPYIPTKEIGKLSRFVQKEPFNALDGGKDGLDFYRIIAKEAFAHLTEGGKVIMEIGADQADSVKNIFGAYKNVSVIKDISGNDRVVIAERN